eukprot:TRINITY_DN73074_c0_g1_i1.p1 TRINITY_DN73074_c0_g1~~TRINITY_DN73074_c0_g1_i1.p1  ORF type:complete len:343 (+),score=55.65 TRINITY_DN73074_c0_g1_i1:70-1098(+)
MAAVAWAPAWPHSAPGYPAGAVPLAAAPAAPCVAAGTQLAVVAPGCGGSTPSWAAAPVASAAASGTAGVMVRHVAPAPVAASVQRCAVTPSFHHVVAAAAPVVHTVTAAPASGAAIIRCGSGTASAPSSPMPLQRRVVRPKVQNRAGPWEPFVDPLSGQDFRDMVNPLKEQQVARAIQANPVWKGFKAAAQKRRTAEGLPEFGLEWVDRRPGELADGLEQPALDDRGRGGYGGADYLGGRGQGAGASGRRAGGARTPERGSSFATAVPGGNAALGGGSLRLGDAPSRGGTFADVALGLPGEPVGGYAGAGGLQVGDLPAEGYGGKKKKKVRASKKSKQSGCC